MKSVRYDVEYGAKHDVSAILFKYDQKTNALHYVKTKTVHVMLREGYLHHLASQIGKQIKGLTSNKH